MQGDLTANVAPALSIPKNVDALVEILMAHAASHNEWSMTEHQEFLEDLERTVSNVTDTQLSLALPRDAPKDYLFTPNSSAACVNEVAPFGHAIDVDYEPDIEADPRLLALGKQLCASCAIQTECLTYGQSPPDLKDGLFGGQTKLKRQAAWQANMDTRLEQLQGMYEKLGKTLLAHVSRQSDADAEAIHGALSPFAKRFIHEVQARQEQQQELPQAVRELLANQEIVERGAMLLTPNALIVMRHWLAAAQNGSDPFAYEFDRQHNPKSCIQQSEELAKTTLAALADESFNYRRWYRTNVNFHHRNVLHFLLNIGQDIPQGSAEDLKRHALEILTLLSKPTRNKRDLPDRQSLLIEHYGLGEELGSSIPTMKKKYGISHHTLRSRMAHGVAELKWRLGIGSDIEDEL